MSEPIKFYCTKCYTPSDSKFEYCPVCYYKGLDLWTSREERYPVSGSTKSFHCPTATCKQVLSTDIMYSEDTHCPSCRNKLEWCKNCGGVGFVTTEAGKQLAFQKGATLLNPEYYQKTKKKYLTYAATLAAIAAILTLLSTNWNLLLTFVIGAVTFTLFAFLFFKNLAAPTYAGLKTGCKDCSGTPGDQPINQGAGVN